MKTSNIQTTHAPAIIKGWVRGISASSIADVAALEWVVMTPTQLAANTNDWAPVDATDATIDLDTASIIRASTDASRNLTGLIAPNPADEVLKVLENVGAFNLVLVHNATSTAANRFLCPGDVDLTLVPDTAAFLLYDTVSSRWRVAASGGGSGSVPAGTFELAIEGGQSVIKAHGAMGATETFDPTDGNVHTGTLDANCTFTLNVPTGSGACTLEFWLTEDGTGGRTVTWPGSVTEQGTHDTTAGTTQRVVVETINTGSAWLATWVGGSGSFATPAIVLGTAAGAGVATTTIRSDSTIVAFDATVPTTQALGDAAATGSAAFAAHRDHKHAMPALSTATPLIESGSGAVGSALPSSREDHVHPSATSTSSGAHQHVAGEQHLSDGSTTTYTLDAYYEAGSVEAFNATTIAWLTVTEVAPDKATVSAAGASGDKIVFNYAASIF